MVPVLMDWPRLQVARAALVSFDDVNCRQLLFRDSPRWRAPFGQPKKYAAAVRKMANPVVTALIGGGMSGYSARTPSLP